MLPNVAKLDQNANYSAINQKVAFCIDNLNQAFIETTDPATFPCDLLVYLQQNG